MNVRVSGAYVYLTCIYVLISWISLDNNLENNFPFTFRFDDLMVSGSNNAKSSVQKSIRNSVKDTFPYIADYMDQIVPKKGDLKVVKWYE